MRCEFVECLTPAEETEQVVQCSLVSFSPLDGMDETVTYFQPPARQGPRRRPVSVLALNGHLVSNLAVFGILEA